MQAISTYLLKNHKSKPLKVYFIDLQDSENSALLNKLAFWFSIKVFL